jgi:Glycoside hydrolase family 44
MLIRFSTAAILLGTMTPLLGCSTAKESASDADAGTSDGGSSGPLQLSVSPADGAHPISSRIYGINGAAAAGTIKAKMVRLGGNPLPAYNWEINATNGGKIEGFVNRASSNSTAPGGAAKEVIDAATANAGTAILSVPVGDYVAADTLPGDVHTTTDFLTSRFKKNEPTKGAAFLSVPDPTDDSVYQDEFANWVKGVAGTTPVVFALDNQPELWSEDHAEIHPALLTYSEIITRDTTFAKAIKSAWPGATVSASVAYGWQGFINLQNAPDAPANGDFLTYYLDQLQSADTANGSRLLDYLDLHWWPEATGGGQRIIVADASPDVVAARVQAPRSLWDASYHETSWINDSLTASGETINLIPRMQSLITAHYPGTKLAFSAWYYGGGGDVSGAIATADVLGILGRDSIDMAALELPIGGGDDSFTFAGFQAFLNYDGAGAHFGDTSINTTTSDSAAASIYASTDSTDASHVVIIVINKQVNDQSAAITIAGSTSFASCAVYTLTSSGASFAAAAPLAASGANAFTYTMPKLSVSVLVPKS